MYDKLDIFKVTKAQMDWLAQRQEVLAENIANANTPRYLPKDLKPVSFKEVLTGTQAPTVTAVATNSAHIVPEMGIDPFKSVTQRKTYESAPDGNAVILEEQMAKIGESGTSFNTSASLFQKYQKMIMNALGQR
ncbi:flagellar basal body rod protein FlgB [Magnetospirillum molischianum]|uniref:Flagellar basal body rod protein FlgB n=1 Tax=Magnetospirillum molischianum DSM 120 TaxID=1150626 RepID=H8FMS2_MAGML|nr:flagellar basal body rod protein FlgB [Magnetospirillum molischianum]CCG39660.1 Flagellar basal body protein [Magnetospirillum molischianum DSM 120]